MGLYLTSEDQSPMPSRTILTPNAMEVNRLYKALFDEKSTFKYDEEQLKDSLEDDIGEIDMENELVNYIASMSK